MFLKKSRNITIILAFFCLWALWFQYNNSKNSQHFRPTKGEMLYPRAGHQAILLKDGRVLIVGGNRLQKDRPGILEPILDAEIYDPITETFSFAGKMNFFHQDGTLTLLPDGRVFLAGGKGKRLNQCPSNMVTSEIFDPQRKQFTAVGKMNTPRAEHGATLLPDGKVLISAGSEYICSAKGKNLTDVGAYLNSQEIFDPKTGQFSLSQSLLVGHNKAQVIRFSQDEILIAGRAVRGLAPEAETRKDVEIYNFSKKQSRFLNITPLEVSTVKLQAIDPQTIIAIGEKGSPNRYNLQIYSLNRRENVFKSQFVSATKVHGFYPEVANIRAKNIFIFLNFVPGYLDTLPDSHAFRYDFKNNTLQDIGGYPRGPMYDVPIVPLKNGQVLLIGGQCRTKCHDNTHFTWLYRS